MAVCALAIGPLGGWAVDRYGARRIVLPLLLVEAVGVGSVGFTHTVWQALLSVTLIGAGGGVSGRPTPRSCRRSPTGWSARKRSG